MADHSNGKDAKTGRFTEGNRFWEARATHGPPQKYETPEDLWAACVEYFEWVEDNPLYEDKIVAYQGDVKHVPVAKMRAMTITGLALFLNIARSTWDHWRDNRSDLSDVIARAEAVIYQQKFAGASADLLNANIISRDLGLVDKTEQSGQMRVTLESDSTDL